MTLFVSQNAECSRSIRDFKFILTTIDLGYRRRSPRWGHFVLKPVQEEVVGTNER